MTCGVKHIKFWYINEKDVKKGLFMGKGDPTNFPCCTYSDAGVPFTGGCNGEVYEWEGRSLKDTPAKIVGGAVHSIRFADGKLYAGGKDGKVYEVNGKTGTSVFEGNGSLIRSIDAHGGKLLIGRRDGSIVDGDGNYLMQSHDEGEVWGAAHIDG